MSERREEAPAEEAVAEAGPVGDPGSVDPVVEGVAVGPGGFPGVSGDGVGPGSGDAAEAPEAAPDDGTANAPVPVLDLAGADASLLALVDRLTAVLERSDLGELEVGAGDTTIVLRSPVAVDRSASPVGAGMVADPAAAGAASVATEARGEASKAPHADPAIPPSVKAPLTGIFYGAPSPGAMPYVAVGDHVAVGQTIGLIEAMKLFNEIKSDLAGRVVRVCVDNGVLVKTKQALIEVEPA
jgi:acetyl-CoA carboxylase biotin carboxyl carrier protein